MCIRDSINPLGPQLTRTEGHVDLVGKSATGALGCFIGDIPVWRADDEDVDISRRPSDFTGIPSRPGPEQVHLIDALDASELLGHHLRRPERPQQQLGEGLGQR